MKRVLDIDLDFFLADCCMPAAIGMRPSVCGHEPYTECEVRRFLEQSCGLSKHNPVRGRIFDTHDKALLMWSELIAAGELEQPFSVTHVDAHSDLGIGRPGPGYVLNNVIAMNLETRRQIQKYYDMKKLDEANYLLFALAFRWIGELVNVRNPKSRADIPKEIINAERNALRLSSFASRFMESVNGAEPEIPYSEYADYTEYRSDGKFDFASLAISPRYSPAEADFLADITAEYFVLI